MVELLAHHIDYLEDAHRLAPTDFNMNPITISALSTHIVTLFEADELLRDVWVTGEVSNWKRAASGHIYFSLKDSGASINSVMWRGNALSHSWLPQAGDQILAHGYVGVYPERGVYQLYVNRIQPAGRGQLYAQFEALKARLESEGLFDAVRKREIVPVGQRIGVVTSPDAAALRDILRVLSARWPLADVVIFPTLVQGSEAPAQIAGALATANHYHLTVEPLDAIILARGGGSIEDLWAFNDEQVAYTLAESVVPVVSGIGHETDFTIADFVADLRAPTPSAAAAAVSPDRSEVDGQLADVARQLARHATARLGAEHTQLKQMAARFARVHPHRRLDLRRQMLDDRTHRLHTGQRSRLDRLRTRSDSAQLRLSALNPLQVLQRGYSIIQREDGHIVMGPEAARDGEMLTVRSAGGDYHVTRTA